MKSRYTVHGADKDTPGKMSLIAKSAHLLFSCAINTLIALLSLILSFALISLLISGIIPGIRVPEKIPHWGTAAILLAAYTIIVLPLKNLHFKFSPHKSYSLYGSQPTHKYGDATLWLALFILSVWFVSEHREEISASLRNFPDWWRNFVDMVGPWFYQ
jgi:hypothetical protein